MFSEIEKEILNTAIPLYQGIDYNVRGRRLRTFLRGIQIGQGPCVKFALATESIYPNAGVVLSYDSVYTWLMGLPEDHVMRIRASRIPIFVPNTDPDSKIPPSLNVALQDLGNEVVSDIVEAAQAFEDPDVYYAGVDESIEPVTDDHVSVVIKGMQRELNRELRYSRDAKGNSNVDKGLLPALPLEKLPWRVQRALVERRRLRFKQWGIGLKEWENRTFSLYNVQEDPDWEPRGFTKKQGPLSTQKPLVMPERLNPKTETIFIRIDDAGYLIYNNLIDERVMSITKSYPYYDEYC